MSETFWTDEKRKAVVTLWYGGHSMRKIARMTGTRALVISDFIRLKGLNHLTTPRGPDFSPSITSSDSRVWEVGDHVFVRDVTAYTFGNAQLHDWTGEGEIDRIRYDCIRVSSGGTSAWIYGTIAVPGNKNDFGRIEKLAAIP